MNERKITVARKMLIDYMNDQRAAKGITHQDIADKTGLTTSVISRFFTSEISPTLDTFIKIAEASECYLFVIDKNSERERWNRNGDKN